MLTLESFKVVYVPPDVEVVPSFMLELILIAALPVAYASDIILSHLNPLSI
jgi:hypothetical protein